LTSGAPTAAPLGVAHAATVGELRRVLDAAGYTEDGIAAALGLPDLSIDDPLEVPLVLRLLVGSEPLASLIRLFRLGIAIDRRDAAAALKPLTLERLAALGLLRTSGEAVTASVTLVPWGDLMLVADHERGNGEPAPDHVLPPSGPSRLLAALTVRRRCARVLDLGTGCGVQAFLAAAHADEVVGTDVNPRALGFAGVGAALNGVDNAAWREGDLFDPVPGMRFDLLLANLPYVVSPEMRFLFRDSGLDGDALSETVVRQAPRYLEEGGFAQMLVTWTSRTGEGRFERLERWLDGTGCDGIVLHYVTHTPLAYAAGWNRPLRASGHVYGDALDRWTAYCRGFGIDELHFGAVTLRRRSGRTWRFTHSMAGGPTEAAGDHVLRLVAAQDFLATRHDWMLLEEPLRIVDDHLLEQTLRLRAGTGEIDKATLSLEGGLGFQVGLDGATIEVLAQLGRGTLREALNHAAVAISAEGDRFVEAAAPAVRRLIELGFVVPLHA
jgi:methylase of polypeptide subunit release factors